MIGESLRDRIEVQLRTRTVTPTGHHDGAWTPDVEVWANVIPVGVSNLARFGQLKNSETTHLIVVRDRQTWEVDKTRFIFGADTFEPLERPQYLGQFQNMTTIEVRTV
jgi:head-tail adaptor